MLGWQSQISIRVSRYVKGTSVNQRPSPKTAQCKSLRFRVTPHDARDRVCPWMRTVLMACPVLLLTLIPGCLDARSESVTNLASMRRDDLSGSLTVTGSSTIAPLMNEAARRFEELHPGVRIDVQTGCSARGLTDVRNGLADIGMVSRELLPEESDLTGRVIAHDGVCMIVHATNPLTALSSQQVQQIYTGELTNWMLLDGPDAAITVISKAAGRSTLDVFVRHFRLKARDIDADVITGDNEQGMKTVAGNPDSIAYVSIGAALQNVERGTALKLLTLDGVTPSTESVADGTFPIMRELNLVTFGEPGPLARALLEFAVSDDVADLVEGLGFVPAVE